MPEIKFFFERQVSRVQVAHLHSAVRASPGFQFYPLIDPMRKWLPIKNSFERI